MKKMNLSQLRAAFWEAFPSLQSHFCKGKRQNNYNATIRSYWVDFVDSEHRNGGITDGLAQSATL